MAVIDDLVSSGLSLTQAQAVIAAGAGSASASDLVSQGFSTTQADVILAGGSVDDLVRQGLFGTQATAIVAAGGGGGGGGGSVQTYDQGTAYSSGGVQASTTELLLIQSNWSNTAAFNAIIAKTSGTTFDVFHTPLGTSLSGSLTSGFTESIDVPGVYIASVNLPGAFVGSPAFCSSLTI